MSKQWGNGFYKGVAAAAANPSGLVGMWIHTRKDGLIQYQLRIEKEVPSVGFICRFYSFLDGTPNKARVFTMAELVDADFYDTDKDMRAAYARESGWSGDDIAWTERLAEALP